VNLFADKTIECSHRFNVGGEFECIKCMWIVCRMHLLC